MVSRTGLFLMEEDHDDFMFSYLILILHFTTTLNSILFWRHVIVFFKAFIKMSCIVKL